MAAVTRQPFAPLDGLRLQSLTSLKNRQNAISPASSGKRKADLLDTNDFENVDPLLFAKRSKGVSSATPSRDSLKKPSSFILNTTKASTAVTNTPPPSTSLLASQTKTGQAKAASAPRRALQPKSCITKLGAANTTAPNSSPISAPAGRSPTRARRSGILSNRRRTTGPCSRIDPPSFSLDAALKGTISSYGSRPASAKKPVPSLLEPEAKASWFFDIHEDTPEQEMTNLLQHGTCVLDISSDEESKQRARREGADGRDKENIPPPDDVSQTSARAVTSTNDDDMVVEKQRAALGEMRAADFYPEGCDETSVILIPEDEELQQAPALDDKPELEVPASIDALIAKPNGTSSRASVLQPIEGTGESFELWESGSAKDEAEPATERS